MPVKQLRPRSPSPTAVALTQRLIAEWQNPCSVNAQPIILEEPGSSGQPMHVYVVWDDWDDLSGIERSEVIISALEARYGSEQATNVTVAMGLTPAEADRLGIQY